ncbi:co-chaperone DjlA [Methylobacter sp. Wu1]|uniref:co-chaperone DjlA n=1 Tax=Methylobacter sp. Wu1 TaxID=3119359 RepID=UPI002F944234
MAWLGKFLGGAFGFLFGGPLGAILGASVGHQFDEGFADIGSSELFGDGDQQRVQMAFFTTTFSVMGHIAKSDGRITPEEIALANRVMDQMGISGALRTTAINLFRQGKQPGFPLDEVLAQFRRECHWRTDLIRIFVEIQLQAAVADGALNDYEERLLLHICAQLRVSRFDYERMKIQLQVQYRFYGQGRQHQKARQQSSLQDAYDVLGLTPAASDAEVKRAYRRLISQHHPDKLVAKGLPEEMMTIAKEKTQQIRKAYETIQKSGRKI